MNGGRRGWQLVLWLAGAFVLYETCLSIISRYSPSLLFSGSAADLGKAEIGVDFSGDIVLKNPFLYPATIEMAQPSCSCLVPQRDFPITIMPLQTWHLPISISGRPKTGALSLAVAFSVRSSALLAKRRRAFSVPVKAVIVSKTDPPVLAVAFGEIGSKDERVERIRFKPSTTLPWTRAEIDTVNLASHDSPFTYELSKEGEEVQLKVSAGGGRWVGGVSDTLMLKLTDDHGVTDSTPVAVTAYFSWEWVQRPPFLIFSPPPAGSQAGRITFSRAVDAELNSSGTFVLSLKHPSFSASRVEAESSSLAFDIEPKVRPDPATGILEFELSADGVNRRLQVPYINR